MSTKIDKTNAFIKRHKTFLACSATAIATCVLTRYITTQQILVNDMATSLMTLHDDFNAIASENVTLFEFLDHKQLRDEYFEFIKERTVAT